MIGQLLQLLRPKLALLNGVTAVGGYLLFPAAADGVPMFAVFCGVVLLAAGGSAINQVLERDLDRLMKRTMNRPLPRGRLSPVVASLIGAVAIMAGLLLLWSFGEMKTILPAAAAILLYLVVYTPLKRRSPVALMIGALCGALAPVVGWFLAGGSTIDYQVVLLAGLLYLWQIPHFWLLQRRHADDYRTAGIPLFKASETGFGYIRVWIVALMAAAMLLPLLGVIDRQVSLWYALLLLPLIILTLLRHEKTLFSYLNLFPLLIVAALFVR